jgi:diadenosine tetraphosphate (Ap4A) HIT family hydrolase
MAANKCDLCTSEVGGEGGKGDEGGELIWQNAKLRVVAVGGSEGEDFPGFCRVVWNAHVKEMSDLSDADKSLIMAVVFRVESALRTALKPAKMNLASLGNMTPHVHWHVIPRFVDDAHFPHAIWASRNPPRKSPDLATLAPEERRAERPIWLAAVRHALQTL